MLRPLIPKGFQYEPSEFLVRIPISRLIYEIYTKKPLMLRVPLNLNLIKILERAKFKENQTLISNPT